MNCQSTPMEQNRRSGNGTVVATIFPRIAAASRTAREQALGCHPRRLIMLVQLADDTRHSLPNTGRIDRVTQAHMGVCRTKLPNRSASAGSRPTVRFRRRRRFQVRPIHLNPPVIDPSVSNRAAYVVVFKRLDHRKSEACSPDSPQSA
jgi:hypothetical protein